MRSLLALITVVLQEDLDETPIDIAPFPVFTRLKRLHDWMTSCLKVFSSVLVPGGVATANVTAN
jgi:hypothetical protein